MTKLPFAVFLIFTTGISFSQSTCDSLILLKKQLYGFKPSELSDSLKDLKATELNIFWNTAHNNPPDGAKCLEAMIKNETRDSYFCFDASSLLVRLDSTDRYLPTVIEGLKKCRLEDLQLSSYLEICFYLGYKKQDIAELTTMLLSVPGAQVFLAEHFITLSAIDASIFLLNEMPIASAENMLSAAILNGNTTAAHNAAVALNLLATDRGDSLLNSLMAKKQLADSTIEFIESDRKNLLIEPAGSATRKEILEALEDVPYNLDKNFFGFAGNENLIGSACKVLTIQYLDKVRSASQRCTRGLSDEALHEYFALTDIIMTVRNKQKK